MSELAKETTEGLKKQVGTLREQLRVFRFEGAGSRRRNVREGREVRKQIARVLTELRARDLQGSRQGLPKRA